MPASLPECRTAGQLPARCCRWRWQGVHLSSKPCSCLRPSPAQILDDLIDGWVANTHEGRLRLRLLLWWRWRWGRFGGDGVRPFLDGRGPRLPPLTSCSVLPRLHAHSTASGPCSQDPTAKQPVDRPTQACCCASSARHERTRREAATRWPHRTLPPPGCRGTAAVHPHAAELVAEALPARVYPVGWGGGRATRRRA